MKTSWQNLLTKPVLITTEIALIKILKILDWKSLIR